MLKKNLKFYSTIFVGLMVFSTATPTIASAATFSNEENVIEEVHNIDEQPTVEEIQSLDRFVSVENNQFIFNLFRRNTFELHNF